MDANQSTDHSVYCYTINFHASNDRKKNIQIFAFDIFFFRLSIYHQPYVIISAAAAFFSLCWILIG